MTGFGRRRWCGQGSLSTVVADTSGRRAHAWVIVRLAYSRNPWVVAVATVASMSVLRSVRAVLAPVRLVWDSGGSGRCWCARQHGPSRRRQWMSGLKVSIRLRSLLSRLADGGVPAASMSRLLAWCGTGSGAVGVGLGGNGAGGGLGQYRHQFDHWQSRHEERWLHWVTRAGVGWRWWQWRTQCSAAISVAGTGSAGACRQDLGEAAARAVPVASSTSTVVGNIGTEGDRASGAVGAIARRRWWQWWCGTSAARSLRRVARVVVQASVSAARWWKWWRSRNVRISEGHR